MSKRLHTLLERGAIDDVFAHLAKTKPTPSDITLLLKHARTWHTRGLLDAQKRACEYVLAQNETQAEAWHLLGFHAQSHGDFAAAEKCYATALSLKPDFAFAELALAQIQMLRTCFRDGRQNYEARFEAVTEKSGADWRGLPIKRWQGEPLAGKSVYIWEEQGLGDIIMFASLLPFILRQLPKSVTLGMSAQLLPLFARSLPDISVEPIEQISNHALGAMALQIYPNRHYMKNIAVDLKPLEAAYEYTQAHGIADYAAPLGDLLVYMPTDFAPAKQYLRADDERKKTLLARLQPLAGSKKLVGMSWQTSNEREALRNIPLEAWLPLLSRTDCFFVSLQHHIMPEIIDAFCTKHHCSIWHDTTLTTHAEDLAALIAVMDYVITADNANVHLAGALGITTTLLLPKGHNFRWPEIKDDKTLWYESVTTIRQKEIGKWDEVMEKTLLTLSGQ